MNNQNEISVLRQRLADSDQTVQRLQLALRETGHRCLNEWQLLAALVDIEMLQHRRLVPIESLARLHTHIRAVAAIHQLLAQHPLLENAERVCVKELLESLLTLLQLTYNDYDLTFEIDEALIPRNRCCSLALICSELVCNAVKHGASKIQVAFQAESEYGSLRVKDDGPGFPQGFDPRASRRMGLEIIESLCRCDLRGAARYENYLGGGQVTVTFPVWMRGAPEDLLAAPQACERDLCLS